ncbi:nuclease [Sphingobium yanoikuyae]|uniref:nuclease n=1 Tax=Sphingobium yanoikuyae TaxID=13690 RepID=UPI0035C67135
MAYSLHDIGDEDRDRSDHWLNDKKDQRRAIVPLRLILIALLMGTLLLVLMRHVLPASTTASVPSVDAPATISTRFAACDDLDGQACVLATDAYAYQGRRYHLADISAPRLEGAACPQEAALARAGRTALQGMLNGGSFEAHADPADSDPTARILLRDGVSLGQLLILKRYARPWSAKPIDWCAAG